MFKDQKRRMPVTSAKETGLLTPTSNSLETKKQAVTRTRTLGIYEKNHQLHDAMRKDGHKALYY